VLGRSHRSKLGKGRLADAIEETKEVLGVPSDYHVGIVPASDTGAFEMAMWSVLGERPIDVCYWESFGKGWMTDIVKQLGLEDSTRHFQADYGKLPALDDTSPDHDVVFTWNGTTSGVCVPNGDWISDDRKGLTLCDATSAAFAMDLPWEKLDITTYSWQKVLGGEGAHGVLILSPRAVERLETYSPSWPMPKIFRLTKDGKLINGIFKGATINTPSMLCVEDYLDALKWAKDIGGMAGLASRTQQNLAIVKDFVDRTPWIDFLAQEPDTTSSTSICLSVSGLTGDQLKAMTGFLESENAALDIGSYRDAPDGLRIWGGATVEPSDMELLMPWLEKAYEHAKSS
jgi:phosphoserine aminotransferase